MKQKNTKEDFQVCCWVLGTLGASLLGNLLSGKGIVRAGSASKKGKGIARAGNGNKTDFNAASSFNKL